MSPKLLGNNKDVALKAHQSIKIKAHNSTRTLRYIILCNLLIYYRGVFATLSQANFLYTHGILVVLQCAMPVGLQKRQGDQQVVNKIRFWIDFRGTQNYSKSTPGRDFSGNFWTRGNVKKCSKSSQKVLPGTGGSLFEYFSIIV